MEDSSSRIALVTGANKGIGYEIARQIGRTGAIVLLGARDKQLGEAAADSLRAEGMDVRLIPIDLGNPAVVRAAALAIESAHGRLDILVNNAGITDRADGPPSQARVEAVRRIFETNFFATLSLTQEMLPLLRKSASARIVNVSSALGSLTRNSDPDWEFARVKLLGYNASKAALNMLTVQLAAELGPNGIKVNSAEPGFTATALNDFRGHQSVAQGAAAAVRLALLGDDGPTGRFFNAHEPQPW